MLGRPDKVSLIFDRRLITKGRHPTPSRYRTRVITDGVTPSLHVEYKHSKIKQYHKLGQALRTETTINDTRDFGISKRLLNQPALAQVGFAANRRLLATQHVSRDPTRGEQCFDRVCRPIVVADQRVPALRFDAPRTQALLAAILSFVLLPNGFNNRDLRQRVAPLLGLQADHMTVGQLTYDLRRLRLHRLIERIPKTHRYQVTDYGLQAAVGLTAAWHHLIREPLTDLTDQWPTVLRHDYERLAQHCALAA